MNAVWKYELNAGGPTTLTLPIHAVPLFAKEMDDRLFIWVLIDPDTSPNDYESRSFGSYGTGYQFSPKIIKYISTIFVSRGGYVHHVFELESPG
jgi:hypothetical protein